MKKQNSGVATRILHEAGMLKKPASGKGWQTRTPRLKHLNDSRQWTYCLSFPDEDNEPE